MYKTRLCIFCILLIFSCLAIPSYSFADRFFQDNDAFFLKYLEQDKFSLDTSAPAVVLYECTTFDFFSSHLRVRKIIKIIKKSGTAYADIVIPMPGNRSGLYFTGVSGIHGTTYNLEGSRIVKQEIDGDNITVEKSGMINDKKISMPAVREGSIIDYSYEISGVRVSKHPVQESIPKLYTKLEIYIPKEITFDLDDNRVPFFIDLDESKKNRPDSLLPYSYTYQEITDKVKRSWVRKNVPAFDDEPFLPCESDYCEFQQVNVRSEHLELSDLPDYVQEYAKSQHLDRINFAFDSWDKINAALTESFHFYRSIMPGSISIKEKTSQLVGDDTSELGMAKKIYKFVRDSIRPSGIRSMFTEKDLAKVLSERSGNSAEINFLLMAMLRQAGLSCSPVILATKDNATAKTGKPELFKYDYTICQLRINDEKYYLDAAEKYNPFGRIPPDCLNGYTRVIDKDKHDTCGIMFSPGMAKEKALYTFTTTSAAANDYTLNCKLYYSDEDAIDKRTEWNEDTTKIKKYILASIKDMPVEAKLKEYKVLNLNDPEKPLTLDYSISLAWPDAGSTVYFNPYGVKIFENNPFKNPKRENPVEFPGTRSYTYTLHMKLPDGFTIDEAPKPAVIELDDKDEYKNMITYSKETNTLDIYSRLQMQRVFFPVKEYDILKEFFQKMSDQQQSTFVIKKQHLH